jgi:hypothetical protein
MRRKRFGNTLLRSAQSLPALKDAPGRQTGVVGAIGKPEILKLGSKLS